MDIATNKPLKDSYKREWSDWFKKPENKVFTACGNRQKPAYDEVMRWLSVAHKAISDPVSVKKSFISAGLYFLNNQNNEAFFPIILTVN